MTMIDIGSIISRIESVLKMYDDARHDIARMLIGTIDKYRDLILTIYNIASKVYNAIRLEGIKYDDPVTARVTFLINVRGVEINDESVVDIEIVEKEITYNRVNLYKMFSNIEIELLNNSSIVMRIFIPGEENIYTIHSINLLLNLPLVLNIIADFAVKVMLRRIETLRENMLNIVKKIDEVLSSNVDVGDVSGRLRALINILDS